MANVNKVFLIGRLTFNPELRHTSSGTAVSELRMAINRVSKSQGGEQRKEVCFVPVTVWGRQAESCHEFLKKGSPLHVEGRLVFESWEADGENRSRLKVVAERVEFLGSPSKPKDSESGEFAQSSDVPMDSC